MIRDKRNLSLAVCGLAVALSVASVFVLGALRSNARKHLIALCNGDSSAQLTRIILTDSTFQLTVNETQEIDFFQRQICQAKHGLNLSAHLMFYTTFDFGWGCRLDDVHVSIDDELRGMMIVFAGNEHDSDWHEYTALFNEPLPPRLYKCLSNLVERARDRRLSGEKQK
jgi:hypothetical protein